MTRSKDEILGEALHHFHVMLNYASHDLDDQLVIDAVCMRPSAALEVLNRLAPGVRDEHFGDDWAAMWGMRNRIVHGYLLVTPPIVRQTLKIDIPSIVSRVERELG